MLHSTALEESSSGAWAMKSRQARSTAAPAPGGAQHPAQEDLRPDRVAGELEEGDHPEVAPAPRRAQKRSGCSAALAVTSSPAAVTTSADRRLSQARPCLRISQPSRRRG